MGQIRAAWAPPREKPAAVGAENDGMGDSLARVAPVERAIVFLRGQRVLLDASLAAMYGVETRALVQAVKRNLARFPGDFMFRLTMDEARRSRSQFVISTG